jgi:hypothetical protein
MSPGWILDFRKIANSLTGGNLSPKVAMATRILDRVHHQWSPLGTAFMGTNQWSLISMLGALPKRGTSELHESVIPRLGNNAFRFH